MLEQPLIKGGSFLFESRAPEEVFTREDISEEQQMFAAVAEEFMRKEVLPRAEQIYAKDWPVTRELLLKAGELVKISNIWVAKRIEMSSPTEGTRTVLMVDEIKFNTGLKEDLFTQQALEKPDTF